MGNSKKKESEYEGIFRSASKSFGFVCLENNEEIYVSKDDTMFAMTGDKVIVKIINNKQGKLREGKIIKILERKDDTIVGIFKKNMGYGFVVPINKKISFDIHIEKKYFGKAVSDSLVVCKLLNSNKKGDNPEGMILEVIGHKDDPNDEITAIVKDFKIKDVFDKETMDEADNVAIPIVESDFKNRHDLRDKLFITIDGEDTKDIDDAISLEMDKNGYKLYVSIADVSHYVKEGKFLDSEALMRGNSVYLLDRVIPMIPHVLSNGMCSLNEGEDRLTLTCEISYDENGNILNHNIYESIINVEKRMTYNKVQDIFDKKDSESKNIDKMLYEMLTLSRIIRKKRVARGAINFDIKETYIEVDEKLNPIAVKEKVRLRAHDLIEDFMVAANEQVAEEFYYREIPFLYRTHENCDDEKIKSLIPIFKSLGVPFTYKQNMHPKEIQKLLSYVKDKPYSFVVMKLVLRSMSQAKYTVKPIGHFALASKYYTHFTSPIRRYSDLQIHRIIKEVLNGKFDEKREEHYKSILDEVAYNISICERKGVEVERDIDELKECQFMKDKIGEVYDGNVSGLTNFGIFVELENTIEGMIALRDLKDDHYVFDENRQEIVGEHKKRRFSFGDKLKVRIKNVSPEIRAIDFVLEE